MKQFPYDAPLQRTSLCEIIIVFVYIDCNYMLNPPVKSLIYQTSLDYFEVQMITWKFIYSSIILKNRQIVVVQYSIAVN